MAEVRSEVGLDTGWQHEAFTFCWIWGGMEANLKEAWKGGRSEKGRLWQWQHHLVGAGGVERDVGRGP